MLNGSPKLSAKLKEKYGEGIADSGKTEEVVNDFGINEDAQPFKLEIDRLGNDLHFCIIMKALKFTFN